MSLSLTDVVTPELAEYENSLKRWAVNAQKPAKIIAFVIDADEVVEALKYAKEHKLPIAIRGGGHSAAGASSVDSGLVIDLSKYMNRCRIDAEEKLAYVQGGALWETVDKAAIKFGLATVGGTVNHTGVAGYTLGGGYGFLSSEHGLAVDNLVQATVVTADGSILIANATQNPDLFFAIRGGGSNFGVVTELVLKLHPQRPTVFAGNLIFPGTEEFVRKVWKAAGDWESSASPKECMLKSLLIGPNRELIVLVFVFYNGTEEEGRKIFKPFFEMGHLLDHTAQVPYETVNGTFNDFMQHGRYYYQTSTYQLKSNVDTAVQCLNHLTNTFSSTNITPAVTFELYNPKKWMSIPKSETAFKREPGQGITLMMAWPGTVDKEQTAKNMELARSSCKTLAALIKAGQPGLTEAQAVGYGNVDADAAEKGNDVKARIVFGENYESLQRIKAKYDPEQVFNRWFPIQPAFDKASL